MKSLQEMTTEELFLTLTGEYGVLPQAQLQELLKNYRAKHGGFKDDSLKATVKACFEELE